MSDKQNSNEQKAEKEKKEEEKKDDADEENAPPSFEAVLQKCIHWVKKASAQGEPRYLGRAVRKLVALRKTLEPAVLRSAIERELSSDEHDKRFVEHLPKQMELESGESEKADSDSPSAGAGDAHSVELEVFFHLLVLIHLIDAAHYDSACQVGTQLIEKLRTISSGHGARDDIDVRRAGRLVSGLLTSKCYFYYSRAYELNDGAKGEYGQIRSKLLEAYRTASLVRDNESKLTLLNLLLRNYLHHSLYSQADLLLQNTEEREQARAASGTPSILANVSNSQLARYFFYKGRIRAIQLNYSEAFEYLSEALRKAPRYESNAVHNSGKGFRLIVNKTLIIVQLLMGEIPERSVFRNPELKAELQPYLAVSKAVRVGDLVRYNQAVTKEHQTFAQDKLYSLIVRLRHNVIKAGLRRINIAYSRISFEDICSKLALDTRADAEYVVAKAIKDGVIDASINHEGGYVESNAAVDIYNTYDPSTQFHKRIEFTLNIRNEAIKAMRYLQEEAVQPVLKNDQFKKKAGVK